MAETGENYTTALRRHREERAAEADSAVVKLSDGEIWVPEGCTVPDEVLRAVNRPSAPVFLAPDYGKAVDGG